MLSYQKEKQQVFPCAYITLLDHTELSNSKISEVTWWKSFPCNQGQLSAKKTRGSFCIFRKACLTVRILPTLSCFCSGAEAVFLPLLPKFVDMAPNSLGPRGLRGFFRMHMGAHVGLLSLGARAMGFGWLGRDKVVRAFLPLVEESSISYWRSLQQKYYLKHKL